jgi:hypothetical protein
MKRGHHILLLSLVLISIAVDAQAPQRVAQKPRTVTFSPISADDLIKWCKDVDEESPNTNTVTCLSYIGGFTDGYNIAMAKFNNEKQAQFARLAK